MLRQIPKPAAYERQARTFEAKVQSIGKPVILRRSIQSKICHCVGRTTSQSNPDCVFCAGSGHPFEERLHQAIIERTSHTSATSAMSERTEVGPEFSPFTKFLFPGTIVPKIEDQVVEIDFTDGDMYHRVISEYQVYGRSRTLEGVFADASSSSPALIYGGVWDAQSITPISFGATTDYWEVFAKLLRRS